MVLLSMLLSSYYSVVMSWAMLYLGSSFTHQLPWTSCNNTWNSENCLSGKLPSQSANESLADPSNYTWTIPSQDFFEYVES